jgi:hypothetical protein
MMIDARKPEILERALTKRLDELLVCRPRIQHTARHIVDEIPELFV